LLLVVKQSAPIVTPRAVIALGIGQCVNWGILYYAFAVLVQPLAQELGVATWVVTGAYSLALLVSAAAAPAVGRWGDRDRGPLMMHAGGIGAATLLAAWTQMPNVVSLYVVWAGLGLCMAATLYEPAFVVVGRAYEDPARRLRALAAVTLLGGLASTVFLPLTAFLVATAGWRGAVLVLAAVLVVSTSITRAFAFRRLPAAASPMGAGDSTARSGDDVVAPARFVFIAGMFALASLASAAFTTNLVPALGERGISPARAAMLGGLIGVMQLPGRALVMTGGLAGSPSRLLAFSLMLQAAGLGGVALAPSMLAAAGATMVFALGAGLTTLLRPHLIQAMVRSGAGGYLNGRIARHQQLARAVGPLAIAWLAGSVGYAAVFTVIAGTFGIAALASEGLQPNVRSRHEA
jgi:MFS family permease